MNSTNEAGGGRPRLMTAEHERILQVGKLPTDLLARLVDAYTAPGPSVVVGPGIGRDAAAIAIDDTILVVKSDPITFATENAARYLVNINANDLACMGAVPKWLTVTSLLPEGTTTPEFVEGQFRELRDACDECGVTLVGGHTEITFGLSRPILVGHMLGIASESGLLKPGGTRPGDRLLLTKGIAIEGTALLAKELGTRLANELGVEFIADAQRLLVNPGISVTTDARVLLQAGGVTALHDPTEGGLAMGVRELALSAGCGIRLDRAAISVLPATKRLADHLVLDPMGMLASGSLLASIEPDAVEISIAACQQAGIPVTEIGVAVEANEGLTWQTQGGIAPLPQFAADEVSRILANCDFGVGC